jgi:hypothetical protein
MELAQALDIVPAIQDGWDHHVAIDAVHLVYMDSVPIQEFVYAILDGQVLHVVQLTAFHYVCMELAQALDIVPAIQDGWDHHVAIVSHVTLHYQHNYLIMVCK